jgi:hypothetical protein
MKPKIILPILCVFLVCACGDYIPPGEPGKNVTAIEIVIDKDPVEVGDLAQLYVMAKLANGDIVEGITTSYTDLETEEFFLVDWDTSNIDIAVVDDEARLIPRTEGFVTVSAFLGELEHSRVVRVDYTGTPALSLIPSNNDQVNDSTDDDEDPPEPPQPPQPGPCQDYAVDVTMFTPGLYSGFGVQSLPDIVLGPPEGAGDGIGGTDVLSLGRLGEIVLDLGDCHVVDGPGIDFLVFENPFFILGDPTDPFAELGVVGVSDDGVNFVEFVCDDAAYPFTGCAGWNPVYSSTMNLISPFDTVAAGGDAFDLSEIGVASARYIMIRDISDYGGGSTAGFDLDAISVINGEVQ